MSNTDFSATAMLGGYSPLDGTMEFYGRINNFLRPDFVVADLGAGRGAWYDDDQTALHRSIRMLQGKVSKVIGLDIDPAVFDNRSTDENLLVVDGKLPLLASSVDVVIADYVLEHVSEPAAIEREAFRVLRPGGLFCARTPHAYHYVSIGAKLVGSLRHARLLRAIQPARKARDVFKTRYRCNTLGQINRIWSQQRWDDYSYIYTAEPSYHFGSKSIYWLLSVLHRLLPLPVVGNIFIFKIKRPDACTS